MNASSLKSLDALAFAGIPSEMLAGYAYTLSSCQFPASAADGKWSRKVEAACVRKLSELRKEIICRLKKTPASEALIHALDVLQGKRDLAKANLFKKLSSVRDYSQLSALELIQLHSMAKEQNEMRLKRGMETFTRTFQWRIVNALLHIDENSPLAQILLLAECLEANNYARCIGLPYAIGQRPDLSSSANLNDDELIERISRLSAELSITARESLIAIADHIQDEIADKGTAAMHIPLLNAILNTNMPSFSYPKIAKALEKAANNSSKANTLTDIELAPAYYTLWTITLKQSYYSRFSRTLRQCYLSLANDKSYPHLGLNSATPNSIASAITLLHNHQQNLWIINDRYSIDKILNKYRTAIIK